MNKAAGAWFYREDICLFWYGVSHFHTASFVIEEEGEYAGAVRIQVLGRTVASIPHEQAETWREAITSMDVPATGWIELDVREPEIDDEGNDIGTTEVDVFMRCKPEPWTAGIPALPPFSPRRVVLSAEASAWFDAKLASNAKSKRAVFSGHLVDFRDSERGWWLQVDDGYAPLSPFDDLDLRRALACSFAPTCHVVVSRRPDHPLSVAALLP